MRTAEAPKDPMIMIRSVPAKALKFTSATAAMPRKAPTQDQAISEKLTAGGLLVEPRIFPMY
jgi:hypothetical protein